MILRFAPDFHKRLKKLPPKVVAKFKERVLLFLNDPYHPLLNNHALAGKYAGSRSINITGDYRVIFQYQDANVVYFLEIGTHAYLYG